MNIALIATGLILIVGGLVAIFAKEVKWVFAAILGCFVLTFGCSFTIIPTGYTGVRTTFGQIDSATVPHGFNWKVPFVQSIEKVNNKQQDITFSDRVWSETEQRTTIFYENITVTYQINPERSAWIYANVSSYEDNLVTQSIMASALKSSSKTLSDVDASNRSIIEPLTLAALQSSLDEKYGESTIIINKVVIGNADFEDSYNAAIADKQKAQLEAERQAIENQRAIEKAEADAKVKETNAAAEAKAKLIAAEAEAEANRLLEESLTERILEEIWIEKWNGQLPHYMMGDGTNLMVGIGSTAENAGE